MATTGPPSPAPWRDRQDHGVHAGEDPDASGSQNLEDSNRRLEIDTESASNFAIAQFADMGNGSGAVFAIGSAADYDDGAIGGCRIGLAAN